MAERLSDAGDSLAGGHHTRAWLNTLKSKPTAWTRPPKGPDNGGVSTHEWVSGRIPYEVPHGPAAGRARWSLFCRPVVGAKEIVHHGAYGPEETLLSTLADVASTRWAVGEGIEQAKGEVGLNEYEVRRWDAWHRHVTLCLLAHASLQVARSVRADGEPAAD